MLPMINQEMMEIIFAVIAPSAKQPGAIYRQGQYMEAPVNKVAHVNEADMELIYGGTCTGFPKCVDVGWYCSCQFLDAVHGGDTINQGLVYIHRFKGGGRSSR